ncbi:MAG TPA: hypothetical protein PL183_01085 [Aquamicrobium sp.]|nr:hypothetical protein [Aquamicrobium sp.]
MVAEREDDLLRAEYERCHPDDTFEALQCRAAFSKEDRRLLEDWRAAIRARLAASPPR